MRLLAALEVGLGLVVLVKEALAGGHGLVNGLGKVLALLVLAEELLADEKHSNAEAVALDVLVMAVAGANLLAVLNGIAAQGHSRAVAVAVLYLIFSQALLHHFDHFRLREKFVRAALDVFFREVFGPLKGLLVA